ncbi:MAG: sugar transferase [Saccharofermentans sp.]|jgi:lipopolysaccharide/colanic/teichoic acid biosynthesis glycosyltransferase|nr:sugar transferase [Clostridiales bacterium]MCR5383370.1 sugar transferase [Saccharofermentans sp.]
MQDGKKRLNPKRWYILPKWEELPDELKTEAVKPYYDALSRRKAGLFFKRLLDICAALDLIILLGIPMLIIAIMIKCDSKGPVFFRQERVTTYGAKFRIHKFRTMVNNAEKLGTSVTVDNDIRITKVGSKLRDHRLDEFPQLFDVLAGNMSFVGTRPEVVKYVNRYTDEMNATLLMPAGITSIASIEYKDEAELLEKAEDADEVYVKEILPAKMEYNLKSVKEFGFFKDIGVLFKTVAAVL